MSEFVKVVTAYEMARIERGGNEEAFILQAGAIVAEAAERLLNGKRRVVLLVGKGNKGRDARAAGACLLQKGYRVRAIEGADELDFADDDLIIDGLFGTGFRMGPIDPVIGRIMNAANRAGKPILSIDLPSGIDGTTGQKAKEAIVATETVTLGLYKMGLFLGDAYSHVGTLRLADFGLPQSAVNEASAVALVPRFETLKLPPIHRTQHKYKRGCVVGFGGSKALQGAIKLSGSAAIHAGAGIVKLFTLEEIAPPADELICQLWNEDAWREAIDKASAIFVGPGLGRSPAAKTWLKNHLPSIDKPCVIDADALFFLRELPTWPKQCLITPHRGEMKTLLGGEDEALLERSQALVDARGVTLILKGAPSWILSPQSLPIIIPRGDPGMATAGSGDVLTGILAALIAQNMQIKEAAILGVFLHALSGEAAAQDSTSYGYSASDLIAHLPHAFKSCSKEG